MIIQKSVFIAIAFFLFDSQLFCADTVKIHITTKHHIVDGKYTRGMHVSKQQFYTNEGQLFREINYDDSTYQIKSYTFYFYKNGKIFTEETFNHNDSLINIIKYNYDPSGNLIQKIILGPGKEETVINEKHDFKYDSHNSLSSVTIYSKNKKITQTKYKYDASGKLIKEQTVKKTLLPEDFTNESKIYSYNDKGLIFEIEIRRTFQKGREQQLKELRRYDEANQILEIKTIDANGNLIASKIYQYLMPGFLNTYEERDKDNNIIYQVHFDYKKHFMEIGTQQSIFEKEIMK